MAVNLSPVGGVAAQFFTSTGAVLTGGKLYTYAAGTTTPAVTYTTSQGNVPWTNPVVLDAAGRVPGSGEIWLTDGVIYKFVLKDSNDVLIATYDNITGINSNAVAYTNQQEIVTATAGQTVFNLGISYAPGTNSLSVFVDGVNQYGPGAQYSYVETSSTSVTFNSGLHVGAEVKFTTTQQQGAGAVNASQVTYDPPFTGSVSTSVENKLAESVSVLDFGADPTGVVDSTAAFNAAAAASKRVYIPSGTYSVSNILFRGGEEFIGESRIDTILEVNTNNTGAFYNDWTTSFVVQGRIENISIRAKSGVTGARAFLQLDNSTYTGYTTFCNVETWRNLEISYEGFFIYCLWDQCRDGYRGSPVGGQDHQFIRSVPAAYGQGNTTNLNRVTNSQTYASSASDGFVFVSYGAQWAFYNTGFESGTAPAINCNGILNVVVQGCWFEAINNANIIICNNSPAPNVQSSRPNWIVGNLISCTSANQQFVNVNGPTLSTITNNGFSGVPVGMVLVNSSEVYEAYANIQYSGSGASLLTNIRAARDNVILRGDSEAEATFVNAPQTQNQNILPIGPTGLGASNFTNGGFTSITNIASAIGLAGNAVQFLCSSSNQIAYYQIPAKLVTFLRGKSVTACVLAYASIPDTAPLDQFAMRIWDSVVPSTSNHSATVTVTSTDDTNLAAAYVTHTVSSGATSLYVGFRVGGDANTAAMAVESLKLVLGEIKATSPGF